MEPAAAWVPWDLQLANWDMQSSVWAPGIPVESASTEMFSSYLQSSLPISSTEQLVEYAAETQNDHHIEMAPPEEFEVDFSNRDTKIVVHDPIQVFEKAAHEFEADINMMERKIHRYPAIIRNLKSDWYTVPTTVAIGPYHHGGDGLTAAEKVKHVAAYHCIRGSGRSVQEMYDAVVAVAGEARRLYDKDAVAGLGDDDFLPMMFYDACFLVQYMLTFTTNGYSEMDPSLRSFFDANGNDVDHDVMLLENQLPWPVVEAVMAFTPVPLEEFLAARKECLQDRKGKDYPSIELYEGFEPPHLLGLLRRYIVGRRTDTAARLARREPDKITFSVNAIELAEIGVALTASKNTTTGLIGMEVKNDGTLFAELSLPPLSLNHARASYLINMAALELCATASFFDAGDEESAVCSYLSLMAMLVDREEDVQELRRRHILQGGGGLTDEEALRFFTSLQDLPVGARYYSVMEEIQNYRETMPGRTRLRSFVYRNKKTIVMAFSAIGALVSVLGTLKSLKVQ